MKPALIVSSLSIRNYKGIRELDAQIPPDGALIVGRNKGGKTSTIDALLAALTGRGIDAHSIMNGQPSAEILVSLGEYTVRRVIQREGGGTIEVVNSDGDVKKSPAKWLAETFGSSVDAVALLRADAKKRRAMILAAVPMTVDLATLREFAPELPETDCSGHALEVIDAVRKHFYDARAVANANVKRTAELSASYRAELESIAAKLPADAPPIPPTNAERFDALQVANDALQAACAAVLALDARDAEAKRALERTATTRAQIEGTRALAKSIRDALVPVDPDECATLDALRANAQAALDQLDMERQQAWQRADAYARGRIAAAENETNAARLEAAIAAATVAPASAEERAAAVETGRAAARAASAAGIADQYWTMLCKVEATAGELKHYEGAAKRLTDRVDAFTRDVPAKLFAAQSGIPGVSLEGDDVLLDGKRITAELSGQERIAFCTEIARRASARGRVLIVDGLEALDPEEYDTFAEHATRDGWQLIGTRVARGEVRIEYVRQPESP